MVISFNATSLLHDIANEGESYAHSNHILKIYIPKNTIGIYVNAITKRCEKEMLLLPNMYLALINYPYIDQDSKKMI